MADQLHPDVKVVSDKGYKFAVMEPGVGKLGRKTFSFSIKESKSNWLAVGF